MTGLQLRQRISAAVYELRASGVVPGDRVLITMTPSVDFFALAFATFFVGLYNPLSSTLAHVVSVCVSVYVCVCIGGCLVVLDPAMGLERTNHCVATAAPSAWLYPCGSWFKYLKVCVSYLSNGCRRVIE